MVTWEEEFILAHSLRVQPIMEEKSWWQEPEAAGHLASASRKQREMDAGAQLIPFLLFHSRSPAHEIVLLHSGWVFLPPSAKPVWE